MTAEPPFRSADTTADRLLDEILSPRPPAFALLHRPGAGREGVLDVLVGEVSTAATLAELPLSDEPRGEGPELLTLIPFRQIGERGFEARDDGAPLVAMTVTGHAVVPLPAALARIPDQRIQARNRHVDTSDDDYARIVRAVIEDEIGRGEGANFVIKRSFVADITDYTPRSALTLFRRLVTRESGTYWTFIVHTGDRTLVGASPERHISVSDGVAVMNPISGTYRYPPSGPTVGALMDFLADKKEADELYMVVDEELKMMARICESGGRLTGPFLREMTRLAHTEYYIEGRTGRDVREILHETLFAPTVTGSPLENACRVIGRYERRGRGYYSGVAALIGRDAAGGRTLDSSILIRTADIDAGGRVDIGVGATLVRHSDPESEVAETAAKAAGLLEALCAEPPEQLAEHPDVRGALEGRNEDISGFWRREPAERTFWTPDLIGRRALVVDAEDTFTSMIAHQLRSLGLQVSVRRFDEPYELERHDVVVLGPGPGDPAELTHPKIAHLRGAVDRLLGSGVPFLAVCLSHQVLSGALGLPLRRRKVPNQGVQRVIDLFGRRTRVGFYNTFASHAESEEFEPAGLPGPVSVSRDPETGEVHALRGPGFASMQFHPESVLTSDGVGILRDALLSVLDRLPVPQ
ncbi:anthranilate synthase family protein [Planobispora siamensis]|uniref:anthranilate synthase n=1 Tax=Planobispora siamensis TaxID=936338 RepID=A0A8J3SI11_9ACTN|nr:anthranilate synthase family protein [Planobispora siamensis]GIH94886.1 phenazine-specific anthranilate synthase component I [Planobispora siamensis]